MIEIVHRIELSEPTLKALDRMVMSAVALFANAAYPAVVPPKPLPDVDLDALSDSEISDLVHGREWPKPVCEAPAPETMPDVPPVLIAVPAAPSLEPKPSSPENHVPSVGTFIRRSWTAQEDARLVSELDKPDAAKRLAEELGRTPKSVSNRFFILRHHRARSRAIDDIVAAKPSPVTVKEPPAPKPAAPPAFRKLPPEITSRDGSISIVAGDLAQQMRHAKAEPIDREAVINWAAKNKVSLVDGCDDATMMRQVNAVRVHTYQLKPWRLADTLGGRGHLPPPALGTDYGLQPQQSS